jgi:hypothetical protein
MQAGLTGTFEQQLKREAVLLAELCCHELAGGAAAGVEAGVQLRGRGVAHQRASAICVQQQLLQ